MDHIYIFERKLVSGDAGGLRSKLEELRQHVDDSSARLALDVGPVAAPATRARDVRYVKRGRFRLAEPAPDHIKAAADAYANLPLVSLDRDLHGHRPVTVRNLLHVMVYTRASLEYKRRHHPDMPASEAVMHWIASYASQAKALLWVTKDGPELTADMPVSAPVVVTPDDCRARYLALFNDGELSSIIDPIRSGRFPPERYKELSDSDGSQWCDSSWGEYWTCNPDPRRCQLPYRADN